MSRPATIGEFYGLGFWVVLFFCVSIWGIVQAELRIDAIEKRLGPPNSKPAVKIKFRTGPSKMDGPGERIPWTPSPKKFEYSA